MKIGVIADDLTGATDVAAAFANAGFSAVVLFDPRGAAAPSGNAIAVSTDSRHLSPACAQRKVRHACRRLLGLGCTLIYKKIDSTVQGNIIAEVQTLRRALDSATALICPANPAQGRSVRNGILTVHGKVFADLPASFRAQGLRDAELLRAPLSRGTLDAALRRQPAVLLCDAASKRDLRVLTQAALQFQDRVLLVGSAGMAAQLSRRLARNCIEPRRSSRVGPLAARAYPALVLCGSRNPVTAGQVKWLVQNSHGALVTLENASVAHLQALFAERRPVILKVPIHQQHDRAILRQLRKLSDLFRTGRPPALIVTGGDTAQLVCRWLTPSAIKIWGEVLPGLAAGHIVGGLADGVPVCAKPGGFGRPDSLARAAAMMAGTKPGGRYASRGMGNAPEASDEKASV